jgi:hypothetical protein
MCDGGNHGHFSFGRHHSSRIYRTKTAARDKVQALYTKKVIGRIRRFLLLRKINSISLLPELETAETQANKELEKRGLQLFMARGIRETPPPQTKQTFPRLVPHPEKEGWAVTFGEDQYLVNGLSTGNPQIALVKTRAEGMEIFRLLINAPFSFSMAELRPFVIQLTTLEYATEKKPSES